MSIKHLLGEKKEEFKKGKVENQSISIKSENKSQEEPKTSIKKEVVKNKEVASSVISKDNEETSIKINNTIKNNDSKVIETHLTNSILRDFKEDILDEVKFQEYIYKTISKRFEIIGKNNKVSKYLIINSVLAQFLKQNDDEVQEEIKKFKKKLNDF